MSNVSYLRNAFIGLIAAAVSVGLITLLANAVSPTLYASGFGSAAAEITAGMAMGATLTNGVVAFLVGYVFVRKAWNARAWYVLSGVVMIVTGINSFVGATTTETAIWLNVMHVAAAIAIVPAVAVLLPSRKVRADHHSSLNPLPSAQAA